MTDKKLKIKYNEICQNLAERKLKPAFDGIEQFITENGVVVHLEDWRKLAETYQYMLKYTVEGIQDPERQKIYKRLIVSTFELADKIYEVVRLKSSSSIEYDKKRLYKLDPVDNLESFLKKLEDF